MKSFEDPRTALDGNGERFARSVVESIAAQIEAAALAAAPSVVLLGDVEIARCAAGGW